MAKVAMIVGPGFEDSEVQIPYDQLSEAGHQITVLGSEADQMLEGKRKEARIRVEQRAADANPDAFDALVLPGGHGPDRLRMDKGVVDFVSNFAKSNRPIAAICHGPQLLIEADLVAGRRMTSWPSVKKDLTNAGATWIDAEFVEDGNFITSRGPDDLPAFTNVILTRLREA